MPKSDCRWIPAASFQPAQVALLNANLGRKRLLRQLRRQSPNSNVFSDEPPNIHFGMRKKNLRNFYTLNYIIKVAPTNSARWEEPVLETANCNTIDGKQPMTEQTYRVASDVTLITSFNGGRDLESPGMLVEGETLGC